MIRRLSLLILGVLMLLPIGATKTTSAAPLFTTSHPAPSATLAQVATDAIAEATGSGSPFPTVIPISATANGAHDVRSADFNRDGQLDLIVASREDGNIAWYRNLGGAPPRFEARLITVANGVYTAVPADVDRDGWIDVVVAAVGVLNPSAADAAATNGAGEIFWLQNRLATQNTFVKRAVAANLNYPVSLAIADMDHDGDLDVVGATRDDNRITWYAASAGGATFSPRIVAGDMMGAVGVAVGDIDGDGHPDIVGVGEDNNRILWFRHNGLSNPNFAPHVIRDGPPPPEELDYAKAITVADVDRDGDLDVPFVSEEQNQVGWYENRGRGAAWSEHILATDALHAKAVVAGDIDKDGDIDLVSAAGESGAIVVYENIGGRGKSFSIRTVYGQALGARAVHLADVDGDGDQDLLSASRDDDRILLFSNETTHFTGLFDTQSQFLVASYRQPRSATTADVDRDGDLDVITVSDAIIAWHRNDGNSPPQFTSFTIAEQMSGGRWAHAADIDGDGDIDLFAADTNGKRITWYENLQNVPGAQPYFAVHPVSLFDAPSRDVHSADIDGDGDLDLYAASDEDNAIVWYENQRNGTAPFVRHVVTDQAYYARSSFAADLDGDGDMDLMSASANDDTLAWYENQDRAGRTWRRHVIADFLNGVRHVDAADLDGDGDLDVLAGAELDNSIIWYENLRGAPPTFRYHLLTPDAPGIHAVATGDADNDGDLDVFAAVENGNFVSWYENNGAASPAFTPQIIARNFWVAHAIDVGDIDGDGDLDAVAAARDGGQVSWFENLGGQYRVASSEGEVNNSAPQFVQPVVFTHRGRQDDSPLRANILTLQFLLNTQPMTPAQAKLHFKRIRIAQDSNANGVFDDGRDIVIAESGDFRLDGTGRLRLQVSGPDSALVTNPGAAKRYYIVAERLARNCGVAFGAAAVDATQARIVHVVTSQTAVNTETGTALRAEYVRGLGGDDADPYFRPAVIINELMADNTRTLEDPNEPLEYPDWIELYNPSSIELDLGGMYLSDDPDQPRLSRIPDGVRIPGKGYLVLIADGEPEQGPLHLNLKLSKGGDTVAFYDAPLRGSRLLDQVVFEGMGPDISVGRYPNGSAQWQTLGVPTPGKYNLMEPLVIRNLFFMPLIASDTSCR